MTTGSCLCGSIAFTITGPLRPVIYCHCTQCRKTSGHFWAATKAADIQITFTRQENLAWYPSSPTAKRGFCSKCGASLFWRQDGDDGPSIAAGCLDNPTGLTVDRHIFCDDKGDYYTLDNVSKKGI